MSERTRVISEIRDRNLLQTKRAEPAESPDTLGSPPHVSFMSRLGAVARTVSAPDNLRSFVRPIENRNLKRAEPGAAVLVRVPGSVVEAFKAGERKTPEQFLYIIPKIEYSLEGKRITPITRHEIKRHFKLGRRKNPWRDMYNNANYLVTMPDGSEGLFSVEAYGTDDALFSTTTLRSRQADNKDGIEKFHFTQITSTHEHFTRNHKNIRFIEGEVTRLSEEKGEPYAPTPGFTEKGIDLTDSSVDSDYLATFDVHLALLETVTRRNDRIKIKYYEASDGDKKASS